MDKSFRILIYILSGLCSAFTYDTTNINYPEVRRDNSVSDDYHGTIISDPYRWLETPDSTETETFIENQNSITKSYVDSAADRNAIKAYLEEMANYEKYNCPIRAGGKYYYSKNDGLQNQDVLYVQDSLTGEPSVFLNPNDLSPNGTDFVFGTYFSHDGEIVAYEVQSGGSDWITLYFKNAISGEEMMDKLDYLKFTWVEWSKDNSGVFYARYPANGGVLEHQKIYFHVLGTNQSEDILLVEFPDNPLWFVGFFSLSHDGNYLVVVPAEGIGVHSIYFSDLDIESGNDKLTLIPIVTEFTASFEYITNSGSIFYFKTDKDAPNRKIVAIDFNTPESLWRTIVDERQDDTLDTATVINNDFLVINYIKNISNVLQLHHLSNGTFIKDLLIKDSGAASLCKISGKTDTELFFTHTSYLTPQSIYISNVTTDLDTETQVWKEPVLKNFDRNAYTSKLVFYPSHDGTQIPLYISHRNNLELNGELPTKLHGYGGYGVSTLPSFSWENAVFMQNFNGVLAVANIRGGGEYGNRWWNAGRLLNKQNGFDDFQAAAEYLFTNNYTNPEKLYIQGESNGGLMVAACLNQRPELFGAVIADVGVMDMLRFQQFTIGQAWCSEFGCSDNETHFRNLVKYSPLHNIRVPSGLINQYPPVLVLTADNDDRVLPLHSYKYISELQYTLGRNSNQTNPLLLRVEFDAGHGLVGKPITKQIEESTDVFSFLIQTMGLQIDHHETENSAAKNNFANYIIISIVTIFIIGASAEI